MNDWTVPAETPAYPSAVPPAEPRTEPPAEPPTEPPAVEPRPMVAPLPPSPRRARRAQVIAAAIAIVIAAAALRLYRLDELPPGLFIDQAQYGLDAYRIAQGETFPVFVEGPGGVKERGREPLYMYLMAGIFLLAGPSPYTLKLTSALIGIATVGVVYLAARHWLGPRVALLAAALLAVSRWHLTFSRLGFRAILTPLWVGLVVLALGVLVKRRSRAAAAAFGAVLAAGFYTYPAYWSVPPALALILAAALWDRRAAAARRHADAAGLDQDRGAGEGNDRPAVGGGTSHSALGDGTGHPGVPAPPAAAASPPSIRALMGMAAAAFFLVLAPLAVYASTHASDLLARSREVTLVGGAEGARYGQENTAVRDSAQRVLFMLHLRGDVQTRHNNPGAPMLDLVSGLAFLGGLLALTRPRWPLATRVGLVALWLMPLVPSAVTVEAPSALRAIGTLPAVCAIAAVGIDAAARAVGRLPGVAGRLGAAAVLVVGLGAATVANVRAYFVEWASQPGLGEAYSADIPRFFGYLNDFGRGGDADVVVCPYVYFSPNIAFLALRQQPPFLLLDDVDALLAGATPRDRVFVCDEPAVNALLLRLYPDAAELGRYAIYGSSSGRIYGVPAGRLRRRLPPQEDEQARYFIARMAETFAERSRAW